ncbi:hypothetical protein KDW_20520 [Dictyobacter vulcani]|uniref:Uncharacterized protein n=1 Tax=Dictyobacter vulcani TaxID=2607529 RepID=A0A5J4KN98_9CHLR|nr:hypothetical protein [Dictyobacter vulcani]GER87890.1 hypothetical protein KDW_20520 [Dictyobacter vulcani]
MKFVTTKAPYTVYLEDDDVLYANKGRKPLWSIPCSKITNFEAKTKNVPFLKNVKVHTDSGFEFIKIINAEDYEILLTFFSALGSKPVRNAATRWYHVTTEPTHVKEYTNLRLMEREITESSKFGWKIEAVSATAGHTVGTVRVGHMASTFRSRDKQTVIFRR